MAFTVSFPTEGPPPHPTDVSGWLIEQGEPFEREGLHALRCKAVPLRLVCDPESTTMKGHIELEAHSRLTRLVDLLFHLSKRAGADVRLPGVGPVTRAQLWLALAEDQARLKVAAAVLLSQERSNAHEIHQRLWGLIGALRPGRDLRWDARRQAIVEVLEVGAPDGISAEDAAWHAESPQVGDAVAVPVAGHVHLLAWTWLREAYPGLTDE